VTKYAPKFSDSASDEWLNDFADATSIAATVLMRYKPLEPEMVLQLCGQRFRQWHVTSMSRGKRYFQVPWPEKAQAQKPPEIEAYEAARWARGKISLLDFLRKTTDRGEILAWLKKAHAASGTELSLEDFAAAYRVRGEKLMAADTLSRLSDRFYGQWLVLHVPFRRVEDLMNERIAEKVPREHLNFAWAVFCKHPVARAMWENEEAVRAELKMEGHTQQHADSILRMVTSTRNVLLDYLSGKLDARAEAVSRRRAVEAATARASASAPAAPVWNIQQNLLRRKVNKLVDEVLALQDVQERDEEAEADELREALWQNNKICVCTGPPGSGKSTVAHACVERTLGLGGRVLFALPKAQLASRMRERYGHRVDIDTCHAAFAFGEDVNNLPTLAHYALVVVDEISQLDDRQYERIVQLWNAADRTCVVVLVGDKWQMAGFGDKRPWHSRFWTLLTFRVQLHEAFRCKDPRFWKVLSMLRTSRPDKAVLKFLASKKPWASGARRPPSSCGSC
jgi:DNA replication protein DnaC